MDLLDVRSENRELARVRGLKLFRSNLDGDELKFPKVPTECTWQVREYDAKVPSRRRFHLKQGKSHHLYLRFDNS